MSDNPMSEHVTVVVIGGGQAGCLWVLPGAAWPVVRDPRRQRADRRLVAEAVGLAAPVHAGQVRRPRSGCHSRAGLQLPDEGRDGRLPRGLREALRAAGADGREGRSAVADGDRYIVDAGDRRIEADTWWSRWRTYQAPRVPEFARALDPGIVQLHSSEYRNPAQLRPRRCAHRRRGQLWRRHRHRRRRSHRTWLSGGIRDTCRFGSTSRIARALLPIALPGRLPSVLTVDTPMGRRARPAVISKGGPLIRVKPADLAAAGVERVPRVTGVSNGKPLLADGQVLDVANVIWCTGFHPGFSWIDLPTLVCHADGEPVHERGIVRWTRALLRRAALPVRVVFDDDSRYRAGCRANRRHHPAPGRSGADRPRSGGHQHGRVKHRRSWPALRPRSPKVGCTSGFER